MSPIARQGHRRRMGREGLRAPVALCVAAAAMFAVESTKSTGAPTAVGAPAAATWSAQVFSRPSAMSMPVVAEREAAARAPAVPRRRQIVAARRFLAARAGRTAFAVIDSHGRLSGLRSRALFPSASITKAMLLVAYLDSLERTRAPLTPADRALLGPMVQRSDNDAATAIYSRVGDEGLTRVARRTRMTRFAVAGFWGSARVSAGDQARFFLRVDSLLPAAHRHYARELLRTIVAEQSWGIPRASRPHWNVLFKGGWRPEDSSRLVHQAARLERGDTTLALAVLTTGNPSHGYGTETIRGVAARLVRGRR